MQKPVGPFIVGLNKDAQKQFAALDKSVRERIKKRLEKLEINHDVRTLVGRPDVWVSEIGDYRIYYLIDDATKIKTVFFVGDHKEYEQRYKKMFWKR